MPLVCQVLCPEAYTAQHMIGAQAVFVTLVNILSYYFGGGGGRLSNAKHSLCY
jgi:hypothetical protein